MTPMKASALTACLLSLFGCGSTSTPGLDGGSDGGTDDRPATTLDARADAGAESGDLDGGADAGPDSPDAGEHDGGLDAVADVRSDARFDTGPDARADGGSGSMHLGARVRATSNTGAAQLRADFANAQPIIGPLTATRTFQTTLPVDQSERITPSGSVEITSYRTRNSSSLARFVASMEPQDLLVYYHEPEGPTDWTSGAEFVAAFEAECRAAHTARPGVKFGMIAGAYQYRAGGRGYDGSYLPTHCVDFYAIDTYRDGSNETGFGAIVPLTEVAEFQRWYSLVRTLGKPLLVTEYGRGTVGAGEVASTPSRRAAVIPQDHAWLNAAGFTVWSIWYSDFGPDGRSWRFTDRASLDAWTAATANP